MLEVTRTTFNDYESLLSYFTDLWNWDRVETEDVGTKFYVGNAYIYLSYTDGKVVYAVYHTDEKALIEYDNMVSSGNSVYITCVKNSKSVVLNMNKTTGYDAFVHALYHTIIIGPGTNMVTNAQENVLCLLRSISPDSYSTTSNIGIVCSSDVTAANVAFRSVSSCVYGVSSMTMLKPMNSVESQVVMDDVYIADRCTFNTPICGECTVNGKKYYMANVVWLPYD